MTECKYTLRELMTDLEEFRDILEELDIDYAKKIILVNSLYKRITLIKEYLSEDVVPPKKFSIQQMVTRGMKNMGQE